MGNNIDTVFPFRSVQHQADQHVKMTTKGAKKQRVITGIEKELIEIAIRIEIIWIIIWHGISPLRWIKLYKAMDPHRRNILEGLRIRKIVRVGSQYHWGVYIPAWPSRTFHEFVTAELSRIYPLKAKTNSLTNIYLAITNKCPLQCEHCYEWDALNKKEKQSLNELRLIIRRFQDRGVSQIHISGGEPLVRINDLLELIRTARSNTEFWVLTSGFNLTADNAKKLKDAGLKGVMISFDHFNPVLHDKFRGYAQSYTNAIHAVENSMENGLVTVLNICLTREFVTEDNLMKYLQLAKRMGVPFVQFLEPRAVGHYKNQDVELTSDQTRMVEDFYLKINYDDRYLEYPSICYHGYHQRRMGCHGAAKRSLYVDTLGNIHACPFCQTSSGKANCDDIDHAIQKLQRKGCPKFEDPGSFMSIQ